MGKKRELSIFDSIEELETQDRRADGKRHKQQRADRQRAEQVQQQTKIYHHLVEARILLQRAITNNDKKDFTSTSSPTFRETCNALLEKLLTARSQISGFGEQGEDCYKEILSSMSSRDRLFDTLQSEYEQHQEQWKQILDQRHKSLRLQSGLTAKSSQFRVMDASFWEQVESTVEYETIRNNAISNKHDNNNTYDDAKVYQQLLKDFVSNHSRQNSSEGAAAAAERFRLAQRKSKKEQRKQVDRQASKGRKLRYKEIPKLVNFTFPLSRPHNNNSSLNQDEYFQSLFGGVVAGRKK